MNEDKDLVKMKTRYLSWTLVYINVVMGLIIFFALCFLAMLIYFILR